MSKVTQEYFDLMLHWKEGAVIGYLCDNVGKLKRAIQVLRLRHAELERLEQRDDMDYEAMADCTLLAEFLEKRLHTLTTTKALTATGFSAGTGSTLPEG